jgi:hypothetical protein
VRGEPAVGLHQRAETEQPPCPGRGAITGRRRQLEGKPVRGVLRRAVGAHVDVAVEAHVTREAPGLRVLGQAQQAAGSARPREQTCPGMSDSGLGTRDSGRPYSAYHERCAGGAAEVIGVEVGQQSSVPSERVERGCPRLGARQVDVTAGAVRADVPPTPAAKYHPHRFKHNNH